MADRPRRLLGTAAGLRAPVTTPRSSVAPGTALRMTEAPPGARTHRLLSLLTLVRGCSSDGGAISRPKTAQHAGAGLLKNRWRFAGTGCPGDAAQHISVWPPRCT